MRLIDFFRDTFVERLEDHDSEEVPIDEVVPTEPPKLPGPKRSRKPKITEVSEMTMFKTLVININRVLAIVFFILLAAIIGYPLLNPAIKVPDIIPNTFSAILGYFVSVAMTFLERYGRK